MTTTASPSFRNALSVGGSEQPTKPDTNVLEEVSEIPIPKHAVQNIYRRNRLLLKGCPKLIRLVEKYNSNFEKTLAENHKYS